jgi:hypothetical protein
MLDDLDRWRRWQLKYLAGVVQAVATQKVVAVGAAVESMFDDTSRRHTLSSAIVLACTLLTRRFGFGRLGRVWLDEGRRVAPLLFKVGDARQSRRQLFLEVADLSVQIAVVGLQSRVLSAQAPNFILKPHWPSIA